MGLAECLNAPHGWVKLRSWLDQEKRNLLRQGLPDTASCDKNAERGQILNFYTAECRAI